MTGYLPSMSGLSWLGVEMTSNLLPLFTSQPQPEPNRPIAAAVTSSLNLSNDPNVESIALAELPIGLPLGFLGSINSQNSEWLWCPPPLSRTAVLIASGT